jgi:hypothetical protein
VADEKSEKKKDGGISPKTSSRDKTRATIEAILGKQPANPEKDVIKPFALGNAQKSEISNAAAIPIVAIEPARKKAPDLDLDQRLMADQRKYSAVNRQGPGQKNVTIKEPMVHVPIKFIMGQKDVKNRRPLGSRNQIIKEIVAKDIAKMYQKAIFSSSKK